VKKIPYGILALQLEVLYSIPIDSKNNQAIEEHCEMIAKFVEDAGWTFDEFVQESLKDFLTPNFNKMN